MKNSYVDRGPGATSDAIGRMAAARVRSLDSSVSPIPGGRSGYRSDRVSEIGGTRVVKRSFVW